jgi:chromosome segregation ATPase|uniref:Chromosome partition protein n=1 Tax=virus sp. ctQ5V6 TaxID=2825815 RepID=A0A8S5RQG9_9VIRU|nr:MAG TPA: chromosome partition protein [virus sp. ctQ5V6]
MKAILKTLRLENFKSVVDKTYDFGDITRINGMNRLGKTTIGTAIFWLFSDKGYELNSNPNIRPDDGRECVPTVTATLDIDGKEVVISKMQKQKVGKPDENGVSKVTLSNSYEINSVPKTNRDFVAYMEELGFDFDKFLVCSHPDVFTKDLNQKKKQDEMREHLFAMSNSKSDLEIAKMSKETAEVAKLLESYKFEEIEVMNKASKKKASEQLDAIPNQIIGLEKAKVDVDVAEQELAKAEIVRSLEEIDKKISNAGNALNDLRDQEMKLQFEMSGIMQPMNNAFSQRKRELEDLRFQANRQLESIKHNIKESESAYSSSVDEYARVTSTREKLLRKYMTMKESKFNEDDWKFDESTTVCSLCGQNLPLDKVEELRSEFEQKKADAMVAFSDLKAKSLAETVEKGDYCKKKLSELELRNKELTDSIAHLNEKLPEVEKTVSDLDKKISELPDHADYESNEKYRELLAKDNEVKAEIAKIEASGVDKTVEDLKSQKQELQLQLIEVNKVIAQAENNVRIDEQIAEMQAKQTEYAQVKADAENILNQLSEVSKRKNNLLVDEINSHFSIVKWKLYDYQKNGEYKEVCIPTVPDEKTGIYKVFGDTTNKGREIEAKLDICDSFQKFYGMRVPIVLDNAESINDEYIPKVDTQLILLTVTKDKDLKVEVL